MPQTTTGKRLVYAYRKVDAPDSEDIDEVEHEAADMLRDKIRAALLVNPHRTERCNVHWRCKEVGATHESQIACRETNHFWVLCFREDDVKAALGDDT